MTAALAPRPAFTLRAVPVPAAPARNRDPYRHLEPDLLRLAAMGADDPARTPLRNELAVAFGPVCRNVVRRFLRHGEPAEDLEQVATIGLVKALDHFRPPEFDPITAFMGYAVPTITGEIQRHLRDHTWVVHVPRRIKEIQSRLWRAGAELTLLHGRSPRPSELAAHLGVSSELVVEALQAGSARRPASMDVPVGDGDERLVDGLSYLDDALTNVQVRTELRDALRLLPDRSVRIIAMRFFDGMTQTQIAAELGISQMHVSRLLSRALTTLRTVVAA